MPAMNEIKKEIEADASRLNWNYCGKFSPYQRAAWQRIVSAPRDLAIEVLKEYREKLRLDAEAQDIPFCPASLDWDLSMEK
jgi:hypothetical protein